MDLNDIVRKHLDIFESLLSRNFELVIHDKSLPRLKRQSYAEYEEHAGIRLKVLDEDSWLFSGKNALYFNELYTKMLVKYGEDVVLSKVGPDELRRVLAVTMEQFQTKMLTKLPLTARVYHERAIRPPNGNRTKVTRESLLYLPNRSYDARIVGMGGYRLPEDLHAWLTRHLSIPYNPEHNPRRRQKVRKGARDRYVFAFNQGSFINGFIDVLVEGKDHVLASRNWKSICPHVVGKREDVRGSKNSRRSGSTPRASTNPVLFMKWVYENALVMDHFCGAALLVMDDWSHSLCFFAHLAPSRKHPKNSTHRELVIHLLDPHATTNTEPRATRDLVKALVEANHLFKRRSPASLRDMVIDRVNVINTANTCGFKKDDVRMLAVQYRFENSCTLASVALLLSLARDLRRYPVDATLNKRRFCRKVFDNVRPQDVVIAAQLARN